MFRLLQFSCDKATQQEGGQPSRAEDGGFFLIEPFWLTLQYLGMTITREETALMWKAAGLQPDEPLELGQFQLMTRDALREINFDARAQTSEHLWALVRAAPHVFHMPRSTRCHGNRDRLRVPFSGIGPLCFV